MTSPRKRIINHRAVFKHRTKKDDYEELSMELIISARKTGTLDMSGKRMHTVPDKIWNINEYTEEELKQLCRELDFTVAKDHWWEQESLKNLNLSANSLTTIDRKVSCLSDLTLLNLHDNLLEELPETFGYLSKLTKLDLSCNKLKCLPSSFYKLVELKWLDLRNNILEDLDPAIGDLVMLDFLNFSGNNLTSLPIGLGYLVRLVTLDLSHNLLKELPPDLTSMRSLKKLDVSFNQLENVPFLGELRKLEILILRSNNMKIFPDVTGCSSLRELHLSNNNIEEIDVVSLESIALLKVLTLKSNRIKTIPEEIVHLINLEHFDLSYNTLSTIPSCIGIMPNLRNFNIDGNNLENIRRDIVQCGTWRVLRHLRQSGVNSSNLETHDSPLLSESSTEFPDKYMMRNMRLLSLVGRGLAQIPDGVLSDAREAEVSCVDLSKNKLSDLPDALSLVGTITDLKLSCNQLTELPDWLGVNFTRLQFLDLNKNRLSTLPNAISSIDSLIEINISFNRFTELPDCLSELTNLQILVASDNQIAKLNVQCLSKLKKLATLDVSNNNISSVPPELGNLRNLRFFHKKSHCIHRHVIHVLPICFIAFIHIATTFVCTFTMLHLLILRNLLLSGNSFKQPRQTTLMKGTEEILAYLRDRIPTNS